MFSEIFIRELQEHIKSLKLLVIFIFFIVLTIVSSLLFINDHNERVSQFNRNMTETNQTISKNVDRSYALYRLFSYNWEGPYVYKQPNRLGFITRGKAEYLPNAFSPSAFRVYGPFKKTSTNIMIGQPGMLDWSLIFSVVLSFAAIVLTFDSICGERERGTLRLLLTNRVSKFTLLMGKFAGVMAALAIPLLLAVLIQILILQLGGILFSGGDWVRIGLSVLFTLVYVAFFSMLGLLLSCSFRNSSTSIVTGLLVWALIVVVIPGLSSLFARDLVKIPTREQAYDRAGEQWDAAFEKYTREHPDMLPGYSGHWSPGEPLERAIVIADAWSKIIQTFRNQQIHQVLVARRLSLLSPAAAYQYGLESLVEAGIYHYRKFFSQVMEHRLAQRRFLVDKYPASTRWFYNYRGGATIEDEEIYRSLGEVAVGLNEVPRFEERPLSLGQNMHTSALYLLLMLAYTAISFIGATIVFLRYDVR